MVMSRSFIYFDFTKQVIMASLKSKVLTKAQQVKFVRKVEKETQAGVARDLGLSDSTIERIKLLGKGNPDNINKVIEYLNA